MLAGVETHFVNSAPGNSLYGWFFLPFAAASSLASAPEVVAELWHRLDLDDDGRLTPAEYAAVDEEGAFLAIDRNDDGNIDIDELVLWVRYTQPRSNAVLSPVGESMVSAANDAVHGQRGGASADVARAAGVTAAAPASRHRHAMLLAAVGIVGVAAAIVFGATLGRASRRHQ